ncbi:MAG: matrixin family metalloprotease [Candidatus Paceibacterota bacterium]
MRSIFFITLITGAVVGTSYWYTRTADICPVPIYYSLGEVDERFAISLDELKTVATEAEAIWEGLTPQELFVYDEEAEFKINLIFDERQQLARTEDDWRARLDQQEFNNQLKLEEVNRLSQRYSEREADYTTKRNEYESQLSKYNDKVDRYNGRGGAPADVFAELQDEQVALSKLATELSRQEQDLNNLANEINTLGEKVNQNITAYNQEVVEYNEMFGSRDIFTQGDFGRKRINIYKFDSKAELTKVLAHEFGHALGLPHVEGEGSVMYYLTTDTDYLSASETDWSALSNVCKDTNTFSHEARRIIRSVLSYL